MIGGRRPCRAGNPRTGASASSDRTLRTSATRARARWSRRPPPHAPKTGLGPDVGADPRRRHRPAAGERGGGRRAAVEEEGARDLQLRRDQLVGLRDPGDHPGPRVAGATALAVLGRRVDRDRRPPGGRGGVLSPGLPGVPERRRGVRGREGEPQPAARARRGRRAADRLRDDRRGIDRVGDRADRVGRARASTTGPDRDRASS